MGVVGEMSLDSSRLLINFSTEKTIMKGYILTKIKIAYENKTISKRTKKGTRIYNVRNDIWIW